MRSHLYVMKQIQNQMKYSITYLLNSLFAKIEFPYLTAEHFLLPTFQPCQYSSCHPPLHPSLHCQSPSPAVGSRAFLAIPVCHVSSVALWLLI
jgi:hypothetical protein